MTSPTQTAVIGRTRMGRFAKGNTGGPGRPRGIDFRATVIARAEAEGISIEDVIWEIFQSLMEQSRKGNVQACKFLIDRLCDKEPERIEVVHRMSDTERAAKITAILASARQREVERAQVEFLG